MLDKFLCLRGAESLGHFCVCCLWGSTEAAVLVKFCAPQGQIGADIAMDLLPLLVPLTSCSGKLLC